MPRSSSHLASWPSGFFNFSSHLSTMVSADENLPSTQVLTVGIYCHNNCQKFLTSHTVVSLALAQRAAVERNNLHVLTPPWTSESTTQRPALLASVSRMNRPSVVGKAKMGALVSKAFSRRNASSRSLIHKNSLWPSVSL